VTDSPYFPHALSVPEPLPDGLDAPYHAALAEGRLVLPRCASCGQWQWPPDVVCFACHTFGLEWVEVPPRGTIYSWTRTWHAARPQLKESVPYLIVLVEVEGAGGIRLIGNLLGGGDQDVACGRAVDGVFEPSSDGAFTLLQWRAVA
jgi:uncharacterized OB-fold protein